MKTSAQKSSTTTATTVIQAANQPFFAKAGGGNFFAPVTHSAAASTVQMKMTVNKPGDKFEQEADHMADKVMRMPTPASPQPNGLLQRQEMPEKQVQRQEEVQRQAMPEKQLQRQEMPEKQVQRQEEVQRQAMPEKQLQRQEAPEKQVQRQDMPEKQVQRQAKEEVQRQAMPEEKVQRKGSGAPAVPATTQSTIQNRTTGGQPLATDVRSQLEPGFGADFSNVRVHSDAAAASLSNQLSARAFTYQNHIFFSRDQYQPGTSEGKKLLAHELTHTIQQGHAVQRSPHVATATTPPSIQRDLFDLPNPTEYIAQKARAIPGFTMLTVVIGFNPITRASVDRSPGNILRGAIEMIPGGSYITQALDNHGVFNKVSDWVSQQFDAIRNIGETIWQNIKQFIKDRSITDLGNLSGVWEQGKALLTGPIAQIKAFAIGLKDGIVTLVKDAILKPIGDFAKKTPGYALLSSVMGSDPITGEAAPQDPEALIGGFMKFINQGEVWAKMQETGAIPRAFAWFQKALASIKSFVAEIPGLFIAAFQALDVMDIILIPRAFAKLAGVFGSFAGRFIDWAGNAVWNLLEIIFDVVSPGALGYIKRTGAALKSILKNPLPFVGNLVKAAKLGFENFAANFGGHLKAGLIDWLTGSLPGVYIPKAFSLVEIGKFVLSILGITWAQIRGKIVKALGKNGEMIMKGLETGFDIVVALVKGGPAAAWELIKEKLSDLKDTVIGGITDFVVDTVVKKAIPKLLAMFVPGAGFVSAIISIYDTIMVFVSKLSKIIQVVTGFIDSIVAIASGAIGAAAKRVEGILAGLLSLAINFLAGFAGLGKVADKVMGVLEKVRTTVDKAIDATITWIVAKAKALFGKLFGKDKKDERTEEQKQADLKMGIAEAQHFLEDKNLSQEQVKKKLPAIRSKYRMTALELVTDTKSDTKEIDHIHGAINPEADGEKIEKETEKAKCILSIGDENLQVMWAGQWSRARVEKFDVSDKNNLVWCVVINGGGRIAFNIEVFNSSYAGGNTVVRQPPAVEAYDRGKHYGNTPTASDRIALGAAKDQVVDHDPPLVKRYYDGDPMYGGKAGKDLTQAERLASAQNRSMMKLQPMSESNQQGGEMSGYSKQKKKELGL